ncbi:MAG: histidinol dehydrogenase [Oscillospiraceae bacterium]|nr:histidinol dehydrogenase [Oscillospiraceae bacterium]
MLPIVMANTPEEKELFTSIASRSKKTEKEIGQAVDRLLEDLYKRGWKAACEQSLRFDKKEPREIPQSEWQTAAHECSPEIIDDMRAAAKNIEEYQRKLLPENITSWQNSDMGGVGQIIRPLQRVGLYAPGGTAAYPSSVLMTAIPARVAGVEEIILVTPPTEHLRPEVLAAADISGVDRLFAIGGVPAIASLALGLGPIPRCDKIAGPGNAYVQDAKRKLFGEIDIDSLAGPSDILIIADSSANPEWIAADLLSQAEHDVLSSVVLVCLDEATANQSLKALERRLEKLPRREIAGTALANYGAVILCQTKQQAVEAANRIAPEHLEIITTDPESLLPGLRNAGAVFLGGYSPEPLGDYWAGPSHVLPTAGSSRFFPALSVDSFLKKISLIAYDRFALEKNYQGIARFARSEGLEAHARSVEARFL